MPLINRLFAFLAAPLSAALDRANSFPAARSIAARREALERSRAGEKVLLAVAYGTTLLGAVMLVLIGLAYLLSGDIWRWPLPLATGALLGYLSLKINDALNRLMR